MIQTNSGFIQNIYIVVYVIAILISLSSVIIIYCFLVQVELDRTKILGSFYAIPNYYVKWLSERCGTFLNKMHIMDNNMNDGSEGEENDLNMDIEEIEKNYCNFIMKLSNWCQTKNSKKNGRQTRKSCLSFENFLCFFNNFSFFHSYFWCQHRSS
jgi:hypothetical protein